jgi:AraC-like DNA-binding protein
MSAPPRFSQFGLTCRRDTPQVMSRVHRHNDIEVNYVERGHMSYWHGGGRVELAAHTTMIFWAAVPHRVIEVAPDTRFYWLTLPLNTFLHWQIEALIQPTLRGDALLDAENADDLLLFRRWANDNAQHEEHQRILLLELEARLRRLALARHNIPTHRHTPHTAAEQMARWIADHHTEPIQVEDVARAVNLHPNYAMRLFQATFGRGINDTLAQFRLATAQRLLVTTQLSAADVAYQAGFGSVSRFYAVFKAWCGQSPTAYRNGLG